MGSVPTDLDGLAAPVTAASVTPRDEVDNQSVVVPVVWWNDQLTRRGLPGAPLTIQERAGHPALSRRSVWQTAAGAADDDDVALRLLWHVLAWGAGSHLRMCTVRMDSIAANVEQAMRALRQAAQLAPSDPAGAYEVLHPRGRSAISGLGPSFGTKFLYFAGGGKPAHPCLILDSYVAAALRRHGWTSLGKWGWPPWTYGRYCDLLARWASALSGDQSGSEHVAPDQIEHWLFRTGR